MPETSFSPPRLSYRQVKVIADDFLSKYHPTFSLPIPIEEIVEFNLKIAILTIPNLKKDFQIDGFISSDFRTITVDDRTFNDYENRSRFTIARELGHKILHEKIYRCYSFGTIDEYLNFQNNLLAEDLYWLDIQANMFAGCLLVPPKVLRLEIDKIIEGLGVGKKRAWDYILPYLADLPKKFKVSPEVLVRSLQKEEILKE
jgi:Zn-dependent peptidase ImmA (M78 family)